MTIEDVIFLWNSQADEFNKWDSLGIDEKFDFLLILLKGDHINWQRADPAALAAFDPSTKLCTMNCGQHRDDPRTVAECKLLCDDCVETRKDK